MYEPYGKESWRDTTYDYSPQTLKKIKETIKRLHAAGLKTAEIAVIVKRCPANVRTHIRKMEQVEKQKNYIDVNILTSEKIIDKVSKEIKIKQSLVQNVIKNAIANAQKQK